MKTVIILFVFILGARPRKPFQSQLFELSLRQRIGSMVSRTRLNLRRLYFSLCLFLHLFSNFLYKLHTKQLTPFTSLVAKLKEIVCKQKHWKFKIAMKVFISSFVYMTIDPGTSSVVASLCCLVELFLAIFWAVFTGFSRFYASLRICSLFRNR